MSLADVVFSGSRRRPCAACLTRSKRRCSRPTKGAASGIVGCFRQSNNCLLSRSCGQSSLLSRRVEGRSVGSRGAGPSFCRGSASAVSQGASLKPEQATTVGRIFGMRTATWWTQRRLRGSSEVEHRRRRPGRVRVFAFCGGRVDVEEVESSTIEHNPWWVPIDYIETSDFSLARPIICGQKTARCPLPACPPGPVQCHPSPAELTTANRRGNVGCIIARAFLAE